ncbi:MAG: histidine phosphatase family protein [Myxococcota bacterium]|nr:histidine phosphatase family protein [Myxococcota bacterium]
MSIYLVRHGETPGNAGRVVQTPETELSARGEEQARRLAQRLAGAGVARILSSDLARATGTAEALRASTGAPLELEPLLQERNFGDVRGTPYAELDFDLFAPDYEPPGGESWAVFHARVDLAWERVRAAAGRTSGHLAVVTHGLVCSSLAARHLGVATAGDPDLRFANTALTVVEAVPPFRVELLACTEHLDGGADPAGGRV